jgi:hypothetical protein
MGVLMSITFFTLFTSFTFFALFASLILRTQRMQRMQQCKDANPSRFQSCNAGNSRQIYGLIVIRLFLWVIRAFQAVIPGKFGDNPRAYWRIANGC